MPAPRSHRLCSQPSASRAEGRWRALPGGPGRRRRFIRIQGHRRHIPMWSLPRGHCLWLHDNGSLCSICRQRANRCPRCRGTHSSPEPTRRRVTAGLEVPPEPARLSSWPPPLGSQSRTVCLSGQQGTDGDTAAKAAMKLGAGATAWPRSPRPGLWAATRSGGRLQESGSFTTGPSRKRVPASSVGCAGQRGHEHVGTTRGPAAAGWEVPAGLQAGQRGARSRCH